MHIVRASFTSDSDREPQAHVYFDDRADWIRVDDTLPRRGGEVGIEPQ